MVRSTIVRKMCSIVVALCWLLPGCADEKKDSVRIATKPMTEQFILGEMLIALIEEHADLDVQITKGVGGGTGNIHPALLSGEFDLYPEYTGTGWAYVLKREGQPAPEIMYTELQKAYGDMGLRWTGLYGFNNTYSLAVNKELADQHALRTFSDLAKIAPELVFGAEYDFFERDDGYAALSNVYGFTFKRTVDMDIGLKYQALESKKADVIVVFTTDGKLGNPSIVVLEDDRSFFPSYHCATVIRDETLKAYPKLNTALAKMDGILDDAHMAALNAQVEDQGRNERDVARDFLKQKGLIQ